VTNDPTVSSAGASLALHDVVIAYKDFVVTDSIDLLAKPGELIAVVGPSGGGKTSILRAIAHLTPPVSGKVYIDDEEVRAVPDCIGMVFQHFELFPWKTVEANVAYGLRARGRPKKEALESTRHLIEMVGLRGFEKHYPHQLSGGMQQRAGLARALAVRPRLLLMDEPFGALDAQTRELMQYELLRIRAQQQATTIFVTHSIDEAVLLGDRVVVLKGRPSKVIEVVDIDLPKPRNRATITSDRFIALRERIWNLVMDSPTNDTSLA
jgi:NitT/TauT family transport system ATP-binding protein